MPLLHGPANDVKRGVDSDVWEAMDEINAAMQEGDSKYGVNAWKRRADPDRVVANVQGARRHMYRWLAGETFDKDSKRRALAHVAARAIIALQLEIDHESRH